jgi:hypothetical protein
VHQEAVAQQEQCNKRRCYNQPGQTRGRHKGECDTIATAMAGCTAMTMATAMATGTAMATAMVTTMGTAMVTVMATATAMAATVTGHTVLMFCLQIVLQNVLKFSCFPANFCRAKHMNG